MAELPIYSDALIKLLQGVVYPDDGVWEKITLHKAPIEEYFANLGLELIFEKDLYAFLSQPKRRDGETIDVKRLIPERPLTLDVTTLLVLLREFALEHDNKQKIGAPIITRSDILDRFAMLISDKGSQTVFEKKLDAAIKVAIDYRLMREQAEGEYEIRALIKARVSAERLSNLINQIRQGYAKE